MPLLCRSIWGPPTNKPSTMLLFFKECTCIHTSYPFLSCTMRLSHGKREGASLPLWVYNFDCNSLNLSKLKFLLVINFFCLFENIVCMKSWYDGSLWVKMKNMSPPMRPVDVTKNVMGSMTSQESSQNVSLNMRAVCIAKYPKPHHNTLRECLSAKWSISFFSSSRRETSWRSDCNCSGGEIGFGITLVTSWATYRNKFWDLEPYIIQWHAL